MTAFFHHLAYDFRTGIRDRSKLLMFYLFPLVLFAFMCSALLNLPGLLVNAREAGVFRSFRINGVTAALLTYAAYAGIGVLIGVAAGNSTVSILVGQLIYIPSIILGGLTVPTSFLPAGLQRVALLLPATHSMRVFMGLGMPGSETVPWLSIGVLAASVVVSFGLSALLFEWDSRASVPSRKAWAALLGIVPFVAVYCGCL
jgi:ABC-2 type transport system permease protein